MALNTNKVGTLGRGLMRAHVYQPNRTHTHHFRRHTHVPVQASGLLVHLDTSVTQVTARAHCVPRLLGRHLRWQRFLLLLRLAQRLFSEVMLGNLGHVPDEGGHQRSLEALRGTPRALRGNQRQSDEIRTNQRHSEALRGTPRQSEAIRGTQTPRTLPFQAQV